MEKQLTYSQTIAKVEEILQKLNSDDFDIDSLAENVKIATELLAVCKQKLYKAEQDLEQIIQDGQ